MQSTIKTTLLLAALTALLVVVGYLLAGSTGAYAFLAISMIMNFVSFWFSDKIALSMSGAQPLSEAQAQQLYADTAELATRMKIPTPKLYLIPSQQPNAFATGRNPENGVIAISEGLLRYLAPNEVRGVLAHELAHIKDRDVLLSTVAAVIAGSISALANIALWTGNGRNRNPIATLALMILAPIAVTIVQLAISRTREFAADKTAAEFTGNPKNLANALLKIDEISRQVPMQVNPALSSLYISNPLNLEGIQSLFSTHPPIGVRVARLEEMA